MTKSKNTGNDPVDGLAYTIHLLDFTRIVNAVYHHCAATGLHYYAKGDDVYPIENVFRHSMKGHEIPEDMPPQVLTDDYCGHSIEVTFTSVIPHIKVPQIPDSVYDLINEDLKENVTDGTFTEEQTGDGLDIWDEEGGKSKNIHTTVAGSWRVIEFNYDLISRIIMWWNNHYTPGVFSLDRFVRYFGQDAGAEYHRQWLDRKENLPDMFGCFVGAYEDGQKFCDMVMEQVAEYESQTKKSHGRE